jgi:DNA-binding SARP family transcriptional activator/TolB-like protein/pimeloyl-ACP methyl ester carboxylesterase/Tfp pilus assembly protein PilF
MPTINVKILGDTLLDRDTGPVQVPTRKAKALLIYLALSPNGSRSREHLSTVFWGRSAEEQARASLRQTLSSLRKVLDGQADLIATDGEFIRVEREWLRIDAFEFEAAAKSGDYSKLEQAAEMYRGELLEGFSLREDPFEEWLAYERQRFRELAIQVMTRLIEHSSMLQNYERAIQQAQRLLTLDPLQEQAHRKLIELYARMGRREQALSQYDACENILARELNVEPSKETRQLKKQLLQGGNELVAPAHLIFDPLPEQKIDYCLSSDGTRIAYARLGEGRPLVKAANWMNHLEFDWESPVWRHYFGFLSKDHELIRYDARANGLSDWDPQEITHEASIRDLEAVIDAAGVSEFPLLGISQGCAVSISYALKYPRRVSHLILFGGFARGALKRGTPGALERMRALKVLIEQGWGMDNPALRQMFTSMFIPGASKEQMDWFNELQRMTTSAENAILLQQANLDIDLVSQLSQITIPTLILHSRGDEVIPLTESEILADRIPNARLVVLESKNHLILEDEPAWSVFCEEIEAFLQAPTSRRQPLATAKAGVAVLPFENLGGDEQEYLCDGVTEDIVTCLARDRSLVVIARASTQKYRSRETEVKQIGQDLGARYIVDGSLRFSNDKIRINVQLIDTGSGSQLWGARFERVMSEIFQLQDEIADSVSGAIIPELNMIERDSAMRQHPENLDAWSLYHKAFWHLYKFTLDDFATSESLFEQAIAMDPGFAQAHAGLAYNLMMHVGYDSSKQELLESAISHARKALSHDGRDAFSHFTLGRILSMRQEFDEAVAELQEALELNPSFAQAWFGLASVGVYSGQYAAALEPVENAIRLSPRDPQIWVFYHTKAQALSGLGRDDEAESWARKAVRHPNSTFWAHTTLVIVLGKLGFLKEAKQALNELLKLRPGYSREAFRQDCFMIAPKGLEAKIEGLRLAGLPEEGNTTGK